MSSGAVQFQGVADCGRQAEDVLAGSLEDPESRALQLAGLLRGLGRAALYGCLLHRDPGPLVRVLDAAGDRQTAWEPPLAEALKRAVGPEKVPAGPGTTVQIPDLGERPWMVAPVLSAPRHYGALVIAGPDPAADVQALSRSLVDCAGTLGLLLRLEELRGEQERLRAELVRQAGLARVGELTNVMAHEFNNSLNGIVLHLAVIGLDAPDKLRGELGVIRDLANGAAAQIRKLQEYSRQQRPPLVPVDLNRVVSETAAWLRGLAAAPDGQRTPSEICFPGGIPPALTSGSLRIEVQLTPDLPPVLATPGDTARLVCLLVVGAAGAVGPGPITARLHTELARNKALLRLEQSGSAVPTEALEKAFDAFAALQPGGLGLELALCKAIVRRFQGSAQIEKRPEGGLIVSLELQLAPTER